MKDPAISVKDKLVTAGVGTFGSGSGWRIFIGHPPVTPDTIILVNGTGGRNPYPHLLVNEPSVSVMVRGQKNGYTVARTKAAAVVTALLGMSTTVLQGDTYQSCNQLGDIAYLGQDENTRPMFVANFWFVVLPVAESGEQRVPIT